MTRRSDALSSLVAELVEAEARVESLRAEEEAARQEFVLARQALDTARERTKDAVERQETTNEALALIARRDAVSDETLAALTDRARI